MWDFYDHHCCRCTIPAKQLDEILPNVLSLRRWVIHSICDISYWYYIKDGSIYYNIKEKSDYEIGRKYDGYKHVTLIFKDWHSILTFLLSENYIDRINEILENTEHVSGECRTYTHTIGKQILFSDEMFCGNILETKTFHNSTIVLMIFYNDRHTVNSMSFRMCYDPEFD
jgi:hypothetical protein